MKYRKKDFNFLDEDQLAFFINEASKVIIEIDNFLISDKDNPKLQMLIKEGDWGQLYELPFHDFTTLSLNSFGLLETFLTSLNKYDPEQFIFDEINLNCEPSQEEIDQYKQSDIVKFFSIAIAAINNIKYFQTKGIYLNQALEKAKESDKCLLETIQFDKTIVNTSIAKNRIKLAEIHNDKDFLKALATVIRKQRTQKDIELNEARLALYLLNLCMGDEKLPQIQMYHLFVDKLKVYSGDFEAFRGFLKTN